MAGLVIAQDAPQPAHERLPPVQGTALKASICALYAVVVAMAILHHEPWADEAQAWLLARDASLYDLWAKLLHYEGTPGLWHTILHALIRVGLPYAGMNVVSGAAGLAAVVLLVTYAPLPIAIRFVLPFTFFLCYQYAVVARSYSLLPVLVFGVAAIYRRERQRLGLMTTLLCLMAAVSAQGFLLSAAIWMKMQWDVFRSRQMLDREGRQRAFLAASIYGCALLICVVSAWPTKDAMFVGTPELSAGNIWGVTRYAFRQAFGEGLIPVGIIALSIRFLWRGGALGFFVFSSALLCVFSAVVYANVWHHGLLFLVWIFAIWISAKGIRLDVPVLIALSLAIAIQGYWTYRSIRYDWTNPYSGSKTASRYLIDHGITENTVYAIGFSSVAVQPYFERNVFKDYKDQNDAGFWLWSKRNHTNDASESLGSSKPDYVLVAYMSAAEKHLWEHLVRDSGYSLANHFDGDIFWRTAKFQPEAMDLFRRGEQTRNCSLASVVNMGDANTSDQLLSGFYEISDNSWRWTARTFQVALQRPPGGETRGARLRVQLYFPDAQLRALGSVTLNTHVAGRKLPRMTFHQGGSYEYVREVSASDLYSAIVPVAFELSKAAPPSTRDARELGAVVTSIGLLAK